MAAKPKKRAEEVAGPFQTRQVGSLEHDQEVAVARFSPCGKFLLSGCYDSRIYRWELSPAETPATDLTDPAPAPASPAHTVLDAHHGWIQGLVFHADEKRMFTGDSWGGIRCWVYAAPSPQPLWRRDEAHSRWMRSMAISPDGTLLATCGADRVIRLWSTEDGAARWESPVQNHDLQCVLFHAGGHLLVGDLMGTVAQWDLTAKKPVRQMDAHILYLKPIVNGAPDINDVGGVRAMAISRDGKWLACAGCQPASPGFFTGKPAIVLIDFESGKQKQILQWDNADPSEGITLDVVWNAEGQLLAGSSGQAGKGAVYTWKPGEKAPWFIERKMPNNRSVALHPDGRKIAVACVRQRSGQSGNGRHVKQDAEYLGFSGRVLLFDPV